jgi:hypothetical protein
MRYADYSSDMRYSFIGKDLGRSANFRLFRLAMEIQAGQCDMNALIFPGRALRGCGVCAHDVW